MDQLVCTCCGAGMDPELDEGTCPDCGCPVPDPADGTVDRHG